MKPEARPLNQVTTEEIQIASFFDKETKPIRNFLGADILTASQFDRENLEIIFNIANQMKALAEQKRVNRTLKGHILATLFYEPSTRTRLSFEAAMLRLGGSVISESAVQFSSIIKGEKLPDTIRVVGGYSDVIALRHAEVGSAKIAADIAAIPIINAGDGPGEHPTQALLDLYTIWKQFGKIDGLEITFLGDLKFGRTVHSLANLLANYKVKINFVAPQFLMISQEKIVDLTEKGVAVETANSLGNLCQDYDVLYVTRLQEERFAQNQQVHLTHLRGMYNLTEDILDKTQAVIMHPLPRVDEIPMSIDKSQRAIYFQQAQNGIYIRMALLKLVLLGN